MSEISIILPVYNAEKYLEKCLDSLKSQTFTDVEILCIDDGSKDKSLEILKSFSRKDKRFKVLSQPNSGPAAARNLGLKNASGTYLMFCDSDDWYQPDMCEKMLHALVKHSVDIVVCSCDIVDEDEHMRPQGEVGYYLLNYSGYQKITDEVVTLTNIMLWNKIFKMELIRQYQIDFPAGYEYDDNCFYWQYMSVAKSAYFLDEKLYNYLRRGDSIMGKVYSKKNKSQYDELYSLEYWYQFLCRHNLENKCRDLFIEQYCSGWNFCMNFLNKKQSLQAEKIFKKFVTCLPEEMSKELKSYCCPSHILRLGTFDIAEIKLVNSCDIITGTKIKDWRLILFSCLTLLNYSHKNNILRIKLLGLTLLKRKLNLD